MKNILNWVIKFIRSNEMMYSWLEERKNDWIPLATNAVQNILNGKTVIIVTDPQREWFSNYIVSHVNSSLQKRPMISFIDIKSVYANFDSIKNREEIDMLSDYLTLTYKDYFFWYIGRGEHKNADIAKKSDNNFLWVLDENYRNSFCLQTIDKNLDIKLIQLYKIFDAMLDAFIFAELSL